LCHLKYRIERGDGVKDEGDDEEDQNITEIKTYRSVEDYPRDVSNSQLKV
jgi:hypothetical protein